MPLPIVKEQSCSKYRIQIMSIKTESLPLQTAVKIFENKRPTCDLSQQVEAECQDSCVEGCSCKGKLIYDSKEKCCIERSTCICTVLEGVAYGEGDKIYSMSDECKSW